MSIDSYSFCPCGSGKKIKFCCCSDLATELGKIVRMFEGDQRQACLTEVDKLIAAGKDRAAFLSVKSRLEIELGENEKARKTAERFAEKYPDNPLAFCQIALLQAMEDAENDGVAALQQSLQICNGKVPSDLLGTLEAVVTRLLVEDKPIAARAHLMLLMAFAKDEDQPMVSAMLNDLLSSPQVPVFLRASFPLPERPESAPWLDQAEKILGSTPIGIWAASADELEGLINRFPKEPWLWAQLASLRSWLGQNTEASKAFRQLASLKHVSLDMAVEAEVVAQLLDDSQSDTVSILNVRCEIPDVEALMEFLLSDKCAVQLNIDQSGSEDEPPPKAAFDLLDKPMVKSVVDLKLDDVPSVLGGILVYGKQTDREARAELSYYSSGDSEEGESWIKQYFEDRLGAEQSKETKEVSVESSVFLRSARPRFPMDGPADDIENLRKRYFTQKTLEVWPQTPFRVLEGNTPAEATKNPALRRSLLATLMRLEFSREVHVHGVNLDGLRAKLGLPRPEPIDPWKNDLNTLPAWKLQHLDTVKLSDEQLEQALRRSSLYVEARSLQLLAKESLARESMRPNFPEPILYGLLARSASFSGEALEYIDLAKKAAVELGDSPAVFMIAELQHLMQRHEVNKFMEVLNELRLRYLDQPGIAEQLQQTLSRLGVQFGPPDQPAGSDQPVPETVPPESESTGIWTPDSDKSTSEGDEPGLWLPGND